MSGLLRRVRPVDLESRGAGGVDPQVAREATEIVEDVRARGEDAVRHHGERLGDIAPGQSLTRDRQDMRAAFETIDDQTRQLLIRVHRRIESFSRAQREGLSDLNVQIEGGQAGHRWIPVNTVGANQNPRSGAVGIW